MAEKAAPPRRRHRRNPGFGLGTRPLPLRQNFEDRLRFAVVLEASLLSPKAGGVIAASITPTLRPEDSMQKLVVHHVLEDETRDGL